MARYKIVCGGSTGPRLEHDFEVASHAMAMEYARKVIPGMTNANYCRFDLFFMGKSDLAIYAGKHLAVFETEQVVTIKYEKAT